MNGDVEQEVLEMMRRYVEAYGRNDVEALNKILADDFCFHQFARHRGYEGTGAIGYTLG